MERSGVCIENNGSYLGHPVINLHGLYPFAEALGCRGGLGYYAGVKVGVGHVLAAYLLHHRDLQQKGTQKSNRIKLNKSPNI